MSSSWGRGWPVWSPPPSSPTPASGWSWSTRSPRRPSAARPGGPSAGSSSIDSPEQRRLRVHDSLELARQDWFGTAGFDRTEDHWPRQWAEAYLQFAAGEKRAWLKEQGIGFFPVVGWAERGGYTRHRARQLRAALPHRLGHRARHRRAVRPPGPGRRRRRTGRAALPAPGRTSWSSAGERSPACAAAVLEASAVARGEASSRTEVERLRDQRAGRRRHRRRHRGQPRAGPQELAGPAGPGAAAAALRRARRTSTATCSRRPRRPAPAWSTSDRMWHYTEGIANHSPVWAQHGIRILPGPSSMWFDATGKRLPVPLFPGFDTLGTLAHIGTTGYEHTWFIATHKIVEKEFGLSGSEQNPDLTGKDIKLAAPPGSRPAWPPRCRRSSTAGRTSSSRPTLPELVAGMNRITGGTPELDPAQIEREIVARDREIAAPVHQGPADHRDPRGPQLPRRQADPGRPAAPDPRPRGRPAGRGPAEPAHPQDARRAGDRPVRPGAASRRGGLPGPVRGG